MGLSDRLIDSAGNPLPVSVEVARLCQVVAGRFLEYRGDMKGTNKQMRLVSVTYALLEALEAEQAAPDIQSKG